jgi:ribonuclease P protein component
MLPQKHRLKHEKDIKALFGKAKGVFDDVTGIKFRKNDLEISRFAVVIGTKISKKAVVRNRIRRQIRAMIHERLGEIKNGFDVLVLVRPKAIDVTRSEIEQHLIRAFTKAGLL